jgi:periplasmic divalent cation tolerance protein
MSNLVMVYTTWPDEESARSAARTLIENKHAACINILAAGTSLYFWQGEIEEARETVMFIKTTRNHIKDVEVLVRQSHKYDIPAFLVLDVDRASPDYDKWLLQALGRQ